MGVKSTYECWLSCHKYPKYPITEKLKLGTKQLFTVPNFLAKIYMIAIN